VASYRFSKNFVILCKFYAAHVEWLLMQLIKLFRRFQRGNRR